MIGIVEETRRLIESALVGDAAVSSLEVSGTHDLDLKAMIAPGALPSTIGGITYGGDRGTPFTREQLVELVVRSQRRRWQRFDDFVLGLTPPGDEEWRSVQVQSGRVPEHGSGWHDLVLAAAHWIVETSGDPAAWQIKEKFGGLRWYSSGLEGDVGSAIIDAAEHLSLHVCEQCGSPGKLVKNRGWYRTRCEEHADA